MALTLLLHKGLVELTGPRNKKTISPISMIPSKGHYWSDPVNPVRKSLTFQRGGSFTPLEKVSNRVFALKGLRPGGNDIFIPAASSGAF